MMIVCISQYLYQIYVTISSIYWIIVIKPKAKKSYVTVIYLLLYFFFCFTLYKIIISSTVENVSKIYNLQCRKIVLEN